MHHSPHFHFSYTKHHTHQRGKTLPLTIINPPPISIDIRKDIIALEDCDNRCRGGFGTVVTDDGDDKCEEGDKDDYKREHASYIVVISDSDGRRKYGCNIFLWEGRDDRHDDDSDMEIFYNGVDICR